MDRREFLRLAGGVTASLTFPRSPLRASMETETPQEGPSGWKVYEVTTRVQVVRPVGATRVWLPVPLTKDTAYHRTFGNSWWVTEGATVGQWIDPVYGAGVLWAEFPEGMHPAIDLTSRFATRDIAVELSGAGTAKAEDPAVLVRYTAPTALLPTDGIVRETSAAIVAGAKTDLEKARAIYEWVVTNGHRDPKTRGCGLGDVKFMLENKALGGKCADLNALFVALARSQGIPARDVYGVRVGPSALGYSSLGKSGGDVTKAQHCRAEFYLAGHGWVPVDPADVRKVILEEKGGKAPDDPMVLSARRRLFGSWEMNWLPFNYAHDLSLPASTHGKLAFLMYPQAETALERVDCLDPENFHYSIRAKALG